MSRDEYYRAQTLLQLIAGAMQQIDLGAMQEVISRAQAVGPVIDPTLYREAGGRLSAIERFARAVRKAKAEIPPEWVQAAHEEAQGGGR